MSVTPENIQSDLDRRLAKLVSIKRNGESWIVTFDESADLPLGLRVHKGERDAFLRSAMRQSGGRVIEPMRRVWFAKHTGESARMLVTVISRRFRAISLKPIGQSTVEKVLSITAAERRGWTKAGLLRTSGTTQMARGANQITLPTYSAVLIEQLSANPDVIAKWRQECPCN